MDTGGDNLRSRKVGGNTGSGSQEGEEFSTVSNSVDDSKIVDLDKPFTKQEKVGYTFLVLLIPWFIWLPLIYIGGFVQSYPSQPWFTGLWFTPAVLTVLYLISWILLMDRPRILRSRAVLTVRGGKPTNQPKGEILLQKLFIVNSIAFIIGSPYEASSRYNANPTAEVPPCVYAIGSIMVFISLLLVTWVFRVNAYAIKVVCEQKDQKLITSGPYSFVRHPMYLFISPLFIGIAMMIGSLYGTLPGFIFVILLMFRTYPEEQFLVNKFGKQYQQYQQKVRFKMFPGIF